MTPDPQREQDEIDAAAAEAGRIGGVAGDEQLDPARRAVIEGGGGVAEGFEESEQALIDHASHGDQHAARAIMQDSGQPEQQGATSADSSGDHEHSSELSDD